MPPHAEYYVNALYELGRDEDVIEFSEKDDAAVERS
jgi:hypothetical protein